MSRRRIRASNLLQEYLQFLRPRACSLSDPGSEASAARNCPWRDSNVWQEPLESPSSESSAFHPGQIRSYSASDITGQESLLQGASAEPFTVECSNYGCPLNRLVLRLHERLLSCSGSPCREQTYLSLLPATYTPDAKLFSVPACTIGRSASARPSRWQTRQ
ncbi:hypothetical protein K402DRAFT_107168 [Aulographum hederae CBS 113979]|uniref:Uncharacterized protein n=1 Tax=Aulographum hederae CBS 113979 TaxID=1176131 RepID=A0A6G1GX99_9PEZI|nr:hypothetical protein K402DRAFT_107168 [Aulographum hederae CBS 113979]